MQRKNKTFNRKAFSLLICIVCAISLWLYVLYVENPERTEWIRDIPITVLGESRLNEKGLALCDVPKDSTVSLKIRTKRSNFRQLSADTITATVDVSSFSLEGENKANVTVSLPASVSDVNVIEKQNVNLSFDVEKYVTRSFEVTPHISRYPASDYSVHSYNMNGDTLSVLVSGGESTIDSIDKVTTTPVDLSDATLDVTKVLSFIAVDSSGNMIDSVDMDFDKTEVTFTLYRTALVPVTVKVSNDNPLVSVRPEPSELEIIGPAEAVNAFVESGKTLTTAPVDEYVYRDMPYAMFDIANLPENITFKDKTFKQIKVLFTNLQPPEIP